MHIVVLDGYTLNPGDLSWGELEELGDCMVHDRTPPEDVVDRARDAEIVLTNKVVLSRDICSCPPEAICRTAVQMTVFDGHVVHHTF